MQNPLVSVVIPTFNRKEYVQIAIESVLAQTYDNIEIILIDDGSTDGTAEIITKNYKDKLVYVWQKNQERSTTRNNGINISNGKYIAFLDSDDYWEKNKLSILVPILENPKNDKYILACSSVWLIDSNGFRLNNNPVGQIKNLSKLKLEDFFRGPKIFASPSNMLLRTEALRKVGGFDQSIHFGEDWDLIIRLRSIGEFYYINTPLINYRINPLGTQNVNDEEKIIEYLDDRLNIIRKNSNLLHGKEFIIQKTTNALLEETALRYFAVGRTQKGFDYLKRARIENLNLFSRNTLMHIISHWVILGAIETFGNSETIEKYFINDFLPTFLELWPAYLGRRPQKKTILAWFYHDLAFIPNREYPQMTLLRKAISNQPMIFFMPSTLKSFFIHNKRQGA